MSSPVRVQTRDYIRENEGGKAKLKLCVKPLARSRARNKPRRWMWVERLGSRRHITKSLLLATDAVLCAAMSVYHFPLLPKPSVSSLFCPFCLA